MNTTIHVLENEILNEIELVIDDAVGGGVNDGNDRDATAECCYDSHAVAAQ